jgi:hypothetical protein
VREIFIHVCMVIARPKCASTCQPCSNVRANLPFSSIVAPRPVIEAKVRKREACDVTFRPTEAKFRQGTHHQLTGFSTSFVLAVCTAAVEPAPKLHGQKAPEYPRCEPISFDKWCFQQVLCRPLIRRVTQRSIFFAAVYPS